MEDRRIIDYATAHAPSRPPTEIRETSLLRAIGVGLLLLGGLAVLTVLALLALAVTVYGVAS